MSSLDQDGNTHRIVLRDYLRPKPITKTLKHLRRVAKSAEHTLGRKMSTLEGGQYVLLVKALRQNRSGQVHGAFIRSYTSLLCVMLCMLSQTLGVNNVILLLQR